MVSILWLVTVHARSQLVRQSICLRLPVRRYACRTPVPVGHVSPLHTQSGWPPMGQEEGSGPLFDRRRD
jgi:hypothetical protein